LSAIVSLSLSVAFRVIRQPIARVQNSIDTLKLVNDLEPAIADFLHSCAMLGDSEAHNFGQFDCLPSARASRSFEISKSVWVGLCQSPPFI